MGGNGENSSLATSYSGAGGAAVGSGGSSPYTGNLGAGGIGTCYLLSAGIFINSSTKNNLNGCICTNNNGTNFCSNRGGNAGNGTGTTTNLNGGGGAGVGGGGGGYNTPNTATGICYIAGGGIYLFNVSTGNSISGCSCNNNNLSNLSTNTGGTGGTVSAGSPGGAGAGVGGGGGGYYPGAPGICYTFGCGILFDASSDGNSIDGCICITNNTGNLSANSNVGNGYAGTTAGGIGICYTDGAGVTLGASSCNSINACDLTANVTCGIQLGSTFSTSVNTLTDNVITNCDIDATLDCTVSPLLNGAVSYATTSTNIFNNIIAIDCLIGFVAQAGTLDKFARNTAYKNTTQYSSTITNTASISGAPSSPGVNITIP